MTRGRLDASREELGAARKLVESEFSRQAISRAYYGAFYAAEAVLLELGDSRSKHSGVIAAFGRHSKADQGLDPTLASLLRELFWMRNAADYDPVSVSVNEAARAIRDAERFVEGVQAWFGARG
jgi:uncharacterized protein (UPF0332 family)